MICYMYYVLYIYDMLYLGKNQSVDLQRLLPKVSKSFEASLIRYSRRWQSKVTEQKVSVPKTKLQNRDGLRSKLTFTFRQNRDGLKEEPLLVTAGWEELGPLVIYCYLYIDRYVLNILHIIILRYMFRNLFGQQI